MARPAERTGVVTSFDDAAGLGTVLGAEGTELTFHCTAIADGSRSIPQGVAVRYDVVPGRLGVWEATALAAIGGDGRAGRAG